MYSGMYLSKVRRNRSATICIHIGVQSRTKATVHGLVRHATSVPRYNRGHATLMRAVTTRRRITDVERLHADVVTLTTLINTPHRRFNCLERINGALDLGPHRWQCRHGTSSNAARNWSLPNLQRCKSTMRCFSYLPTESPAMPPPLRTTKIYKCKAKLSSIAKQQRWYPFNSYRRWSPPRISSTKAMQRWINTSNIRRQLDHEAPREHMSLQGLPKRRPRKCRSAGKNNSNLFAIQPCT